MKSYTDFVEQAVYPVLDVQAVLLVLCFVLWKSKRGDRKNLYKHYEKIHKDLALKNHVITYTC